MIEKTRGIVLRYAPVSNTSRVVTWLTSQFGTISTMVKGSLRPKSMFLGQYDLFYTCELVFYARRQDRLHIAAECAPIKPRSRLRHDWKAAAAASYLADLAVKLSIPDAPHGVYFDFLEAGLDDLADNGVSEDVLFWYELQLLRLFGLAPRFSDCLRCGKKLHVRSPGKTFSYAHGGILCARCTGEEPSASESIAPDVLAILLNWQQARNAQAARSTRSSIQQRNAIETLLGSFMAYHLEISPASRRIALDTLARKVG